MAIGRIPEPGTGIPESIIAAKGDLLTGTANDVPAVLSVGTNGHTLVADSSAATGLKWAAPAAPTGVGATVYRNGATIAYTANTEVLMVPDTSEYDTNSFWASGANASRLTIPSGYAGKYLITITVFQSGAGVGYTYLYIYRNGARLTNGLTSGTLVRQTNLAANVTAITGSLLVNASVGDYFQIYYQSDATTASYATYIRYSISYQGA
jgi:hypothetical protein